MLSSSPGAGPRPPNSSSSGGGGGGGRRTSWRNSIDAAATPVSVSSPDLQRSYGSAASVRSNGSANSQSSQATTNTVIHPQNGYGAQNYSGTTVSGTMMPPRAPSASPSVTSTVTTAHEPRRITGGGGLLVSLRLTGKSVLVVGGGREAVGRTFFALDADARVTLIAPFEGMHSEIRARIMRREITHINRRYRDPDDLFQPPSPAADDDGSAIPNGGPVPAFDLVLGCAEDLAESRAIALSCRANRIPVNCADVPELCDFFFVATHRDGPIQIGVSTNGCGPRMAARIRTHIRDTLPPKTRDAVEKIGSLRAHVRVSDPDPGNASRRMTWLTRLCDTWTVEEMAGMTEEDVTSLLEAYERNEKVPPPPVSQARPLLISPPKQPEKVLDSPSRKDARGGRGPSSYSRIAKVVAGATGLAVSVAMAPFTLAAAVTAGATNAAFGAVKSATTTASQAVDFATSYTAAVRGAAGNVATSTVETGLAVLPNFVSAPIRTVITTVVPESMRPLRSHNPAAAAQISSPNPATSAPTLYLVGAGPGDPGLLTIRAHELLKTADIIVSDQLISKAILDLIDDAPRRLIFVEKKVRGRSDASQLDAQELCLKYLQSGENQIVVRLKGGDPFLFGRGGEEYLYLLAHGHVPVVVPGVSSALAAPASALIPVTHRGVADQVLVLSARGENGALPEVPRHCDRRTTVVLMALARLDRMVALFLEAGYPRSMPAAVVERGTCGPSGGAERVVVASLADIVPRVAEAGVGSPALLVVGGVCEVLRKPTVHHDTYPSGVLAAAASV